MYFLIGILAAVLCLLTSYNAGYSFDYQDRAMDAEIRLRRIVIPSKWRWLFRFRWTYSGDVLLLALIVEVTGLIFAFVMSCLGIVFTVKPFDCATHVMYGVGMLYGFSCHITSVVGTVRYSIKKKKYYKPDPFSKKCWRLEFKAAASLKAYKTPYGKVKVLDLQATKDGQQIYAIQYGRWIVRDFYAVASKKYKPVSGTYAKAIYTSRSPHFMLLSDWCGE